MTVIAIGSVKGSPGVTTLTSALASVWPAARLLVVEADPSGGDLATRLDLPPEPSLVTLAAAGRRLLDTDLVLAHAQAIRTADGVDHRALVAPVSAEHCAVALATIRGRLVDVIANEMTGGDVLIDCGRLDHDSPALELFGHADVAIVLTRPTLSSSHHLASAARFLGRSPLVLTMGERPYTATEVAEAVGLEALGAVPVDPRTASAFSEPESHPGRVSRRSPLVRFARSLAEQLSGGVGARPSSPEGSTPAPAHAGDPLLGIAPLPPPAPVGAEEAHR